MGMLPPDAAKNTGTVLMGGSPIRLPSEAGKVPALPPLTPLDPTMQGASSTSRPAGPRSSSEDFQRSPKDPGIGLIQPTGGSSGPARPPAHPVVSTPNQYVDPLLVERLRARARSGYAGTFLTGPQGVLGLGGGR